MCLNFFFVPVCEKGPLLVQEERSEVIWSSNVANKPGIKAM